MLEKTTRDESSRLGTVRSLGRQEHRFPINLLTMGFLPEHLCRVWDLTSVLFLNIQTRAPTETPGLWTELCGRAKVHRGLSAQQTPYGNAPEPCGAVALPGACWKPLSWGHFPFSPFISFLIGFPYREMDLRLLNLKFLEFISRTITNGFSSSIS